MSRDYGNCPDIQVGVHQGQRIERVYKVPPAPLDGSPEELRQMIKHLLWFRDLDHSSMNFFEVSEASSLPAMRRTKIFPSKSRCVNSKPFGETFFSNETRIKLESRSRLSSKTAELLRSSIISNMYFCSQGLRLGLLMECAEMTDLHFIVATHSLSTPLGEKKKPFRKQH